MGEKQDVLCSRLTTGTCAGREEAQAECARGEQGAHGPLGLGNTGMKKERRNDQKGSFCEQQSHTQREMGGPEANCRPILGMLKQPRFEFKRLLAIVVNKRWLSGSRGQPGAS